MPTAGLVVGAQVSRDGQERVLTVCVCRSLLDDIIDDARGIWKSISNRSVQSQGRRPRRCRRLRPSPRSWPSSTDDRPRCWSEKSPLMIFVGAAGAQSQCDRRAQRRRTLVFPLTGAGPLGGAEAEAGVPAEVSLPPAPNSSEPSLTSTSAGSAGYRRVYFADAEQRAAANSLEAVERHEGQLATAGRREWCSKWLANPLSKNDSSRSLYGDPTECRKRCADSFGPAGKAGRSNDDSRCSRWPSYCRVFAEKIPLAGCRLSSESKPKSMEWPGSADRSHDRGWR